MRNLTVKGKYMRRVNQLMKSSLLTVRMTHCQEKNSPGVDQVKIDLQTRKTTKIFKGREAVGSKRKDLQVNRLKTLKIPIKSCHLISMKGVLKLRKISPLNEVYYTAMLCLFLRKDLRMKMIVKTRKLVK